MREILRNIFTWSRLSEPHGYDFNGYLIRSPGGNLCTDPVEPNKEPFDGTRLRTLPADELARPLEGHALYVSSGNRRGDRANLDLLDLRAKDFSGRSLWRIHMSRADLTGANLEQADLRRAFLVGARLQSARLATADLARARLSGVDLVDADCERACFAEAEVEFAIMA